MNKLLKALVYTSWLWLFLILLALLNSLDPVGAGPGGILIIFLLIYLMIASFLFTLLHWGVRVVSSRIIKRSSSVTARSRKVSVRRAYYIASIVAFGPVLLLALNTVRQLKLADFLLVIAFVALAIFYVSKRES